MIPEARSLKFVSLGKVVSARLRSSLEVLKENTVSFLFFYFTLLGLTLGCRIFNLCCSMQELLVVACELSCGMWDLVP